VFRGKLISVDDGQMVVETSDGSLTVISRAAVADVELQRSQEKPEPKPSLTWKLAVGKRGTYRVEVSYLTGGLTWRADYSTVVNEDGTEMLFSGWATVENRSGVSYDDVGLRLVAGEVHRAAGGGNKMMMAARMEAAPSPVSLEESGLDEYHLYELPWRTSIAVGKVKQVRLVPETEIAAERIYSYDGMSDRGRVKAEIAFRNGKREGLGTALPAGTVKVYKSDKRGGLQFTGEDRIRHTPVEEEARIATGFAFDIVGERLQTASERLSDRRRRESYRIVLRNHKESGVEVRVVERMRGDWEIIRSDREYEKIGAERAEFPLRVPAGGEATVEYTVEMRF
jgi:hypothetical protein